MDENHIISGNETKNSFFVVGIGTSSGGLTALKSFFKSAKTDSSMAYVILLTTELRVDHKNIQASPIWNKFPAEVLTEHKTKIKADCIYIIPAHKRLLTEEGYLSVSKNQTFEEQRSPVDVFLRTLAKGFRTSSMAVILSGKGTSGSMGIRHIKENGGAILVQDPNDAEYAGMPESSIKKGIVDFVLPAGEIPIQLLKYKNQVLSISSASGKESENSGDEIEEALLKIFSVLHQKTGYDFSNYKKSTMIRRMERRLYVLNINNLQQYADFILNDPKEPYSLLKDLLISVTNFFRDSDVFWEIKQNILPKIYKNKSSNETVRIWVAGCATGEEAYTIAMICKEYAETLINPPKIQIFASDIDQPALIFARNGIYSASDITDIPPENVERFFERQGNAFRVKQELKELIVFVHQNILKDPPFSKVDMISCRNLLIYLNQNGQRAVMNTFHFALNNNGYLILGRSESSQKDLFPEYKKSFSIYQKSALQVSILSKEFAGKDYDYLTSKRKDIKNAKENLFVTTEYHHQFLTEYLPASLLLTENGDLLHIFEKAKKYLEFNSGDLSLNIRKLINPQLNLELEEAISETLQNLQETHKSNVSFSRNGIIEKIKIIVRPVNFHEPQEENYLLVIFEPQNSTPTTLLKKNVSPNLSALHDKFQMELGTPKEPLRSRIMEYEIKTTELIRANQKLRAMNQELISTKEEFATGKEELQSINEELATVNLEFKLKNDELSQVNNNFINLINSTEIATLFLDKAFTIRFFSPATKAIFNLIPADVGRGLSDITHNLRGHTIFKDAISVLHHYSPIEKEVISTDGIHYKMHISPYRTAENYVDGVVITFVDIQNQKLSEQNLRESYERTYEILESIKDSFFALDANFNFTYINKKAKEIWGKTESQLIGENFLHSLPQALGENAELKFKEVIDKKEDITYETYVPYLKKWIEVRVFPNKREGISCYFQDITERQNKEKQLIASEAGFKAIVNQAAAGVAKKSLEGQFLFVNNKFCQITGYTEQELLEMSIKDITHPEDLKMSLNSFQTMIKDQCSYDLEKRYIKKDGSICWVHNSGTLILDEHGEAEAALTIIVDITERKQAIEKALKSEIDLRIALEAAELGVWDWDVVSRNITCNDQMYKLLGIPLENEIPSMRNFVHYILPEDRPIVKATLRTAIENNQAFEVDFRIQRNDNGEIHWLHAYGRILNPNKDSKTKRFPGVVFDITKQKILDKHKDEFIGIASHELKTPVTSIKAYTQLLQALFEQSKDNQSVEMIKKMGRQVDRLTTLIKDLLDTTKINEGKLQIDPSEFDLNESILNVIDMILTESEKSKMEIKLENLPNVYADQDRIEQVIVNLIGNAFKYAPDSDKIIICSKVLEDSVLIEVRDFGEGIRQEMKEKIFERFYRIKESSRKVYTGVGLGLYICAEIIKKHQGNIWVESTEGEGSCFCFTLPLN